MRRRNMPRLAAIVITLALSPLGASARAQWTPVSEVPPVDIFSVWANADTIAAGSDSTVFVSFDGGATWATTSKVAAGATMVEAVRVHRGNLYAGTYGQGIFVSHDLGATWQGFSQGLSGGVNGSHLAITNLLLRGDTLYATTDGAGVFIRNLAGGAGWSNFSGVIVPDQAGNMTSIAASPTRLLATGGAIGDVFFRDPGDADWTESLLFNDHLAAGLAPLAAIWTGSSWLVGTNIGVFRSDLGEAPWTYHDFGLHPTFFASFALHDGIVFTHFANGSGTGIEYSGDGGVTWLLLDALPSIFTYSLTAVGDLLYAGRVDGLWRRSVESVSVPIASAPNRLHFAVVGANPVHDDAHLRFELPVAARVQIDLFDVTGRHLPGGIAETRPAGTNEIAYPARQLAPGVYLARLNAVGRSETVRIVRVR